MHLSCLQRCVQHRVGTNDSVILKAKKKKSLCKHNNFFTLQSKQAINLFMALLGESQSAWGVWEESQCLCKGDEQSRQTLCSRLADPREEPCAAHHSWWSWAVWSVPHSLMLSGHYLPPCSPSPPWQFTPGHLFVAVAEWISLFLALLVFVAVHWASGGYSSYSVWASHCNSFSRGEGCAGFVIAVPALSSRGAWTF